MSSSSFDDDPDENSSDIDDGIDDTWRTVSDNSNPDDKPAETIPPIKSIDRNELFKKFYKDPLNQPKKDTYIPITQRDKSTLPPIPKQIPSSKNIARLGRAFLVNNRTKRSMRDRQNFTKKNYDSKENVNPETNDDEIKINYPETNNDVFVNPMKNPASIPDYNVYESPANDFSTNNPLLKPKKIPIADINLEYVPYIQPAPEPDNLPPTPTDAPPIQIPSDVDIQSQVELANSIHNSIVAPPAAAVAAEIPGEIEPPLPPTPVIPSPPAEQPQINIGDQVDIADNTHNSILQAISTPPAPPAVATPPASPSPPVPHAPPQINIREQVDIANNTHNSILQAISIPPAPPAPPALPAPSEPSVPPAPPQINIGDQVDIANNTHNSILGPGQVEPSETLPVFPLSPSPIEPTEPIEEVQPPLPPTPPPPLPPAQNIDNGQKDKLIKIFTLLNGLYKNKFGAPPPPPPPPPPSGQSSPASSTYSTPISSPPGSPPGSPRPSWIPPLPLPPSPALTEEQKQILLRLLLGSLSVMNFMNLSKGIAPIIPTISRSPDVPELNLPGSIPGLSGVPDPEKQILTKLLLGSLSILNVMNLSKDIPAAAAEPEPEPAPVPPLDPEKQILAKLLLSSLSVLNVMNLSKDIIETRRKQGPGPGLGPFGEPGPDEEPFGWPGPDEEPFGWPGQDGEPLGRPPIDQRRGISRQRGIRNISEPDTEDDLKDRLITSFKILKFMAKPPKKGVRFGENDIREFDEYAPVVPPRRAQRRNEMYMGEPDEGEPDEGEHDDGESDDGESDDGESDVAIAQEVPNEPINAMNVRPVDRPRLFPNINIPNIFNILGRRPAGQGQPQPGQPPRQAGWLPGWFNNMLGRPQAGQAPPQPPQEGMPVAEGIPVQDLNQNFGMFGGPAPAAAAPQQPDMNALRNYLKFSLTLLNILNTEIDNKKPHNTKKNNLIKLFIILRKLKGIDKDWPKIGRIPKLPSLPYIGVVPPGVELDTGIVSVFPKFPKLSGIFAGPTEPREPSCPPQKPCPSNDWSSWFSMPQSPIEPSYNKPPFADRVPSEQVSITEYDETGEPKTKLYDYTSEIKEIKPADDDPGKGETHSEPPNKFIEYSISPSDTDAAEEEDSDAAEEDADAAEEDSDADDDKPTPGRL